MGLYAEPRMVTRLDECFFYHTMDLPGFGVVPGHWDLRANFDEYIGGVDLKGQTVLDVGTASGFLTFEAEKRGARVVSFDVSDSSSVNLLPFHHKLYYQDHAAWVRYHTQTYEPLKNGYWLAHRLYQSKAKVHYGNIYQLPQALGKFDVVIVGSVMEHLSDQVGALASISKIAGDLLVVNTTMLDTDLPIARFEARADTPDLDYTWWVYSFSVYKEIFGMLGFSIRKVTETLCYRPLPCTEVGQPRTVLVAQRTPPGQPTVHCSLPRRKEVHPPMRPKGVKHWMKHFIRQTMIGPAGPK
jgi:SAM-dependent methyltransferase